MDKARFLIEAHLRTGRPVGELAKAHGVSRGWLYKLLARYNRGPGRAGAPLPAPAPLAGCHRRWLAGSTRSSSPPGRPSTR